MSQQSTPLLNVEATHEHAMHAMTVAMICKMRNRGKGQQIALEYALRCELRAIILAKMAGDITTACLLQKSATAIAGKCEQLELARELIDSALLHVPDEQPYLKKDLIATDAWLTQLEVDAGIKKGSIWQKMLNVVQ